MTLQSLSARNSQNVSKEKINLGSKNKQKIREKFKIFKKIKLKLSVLKFFSCFCFLLKKEEKFLFNFISIFILFVRQRIIRD
jgi:hypothetical protein